MGIVHNKNINNEPQLSQEPIETEAEKQVRLLRNDVKTLRKENKEFRELLERVLEKLDTQ